MSMDLAVSTDSTRARRWHSRLDWLSAWAAFVCALHCAALPVVLALAPLAGAHWLSSHLFDQWAVVIALVFGAAVIGAAYCTHRWRKVLAMYLGATALMLAGAFGLHDPAWLHALLLASGGLLLALTHVVNRRSAMRHGCTRNLWFRLVGMD